jgi:ankyrin repeat protein
VLRTDLEAVVRLLLEKGANVHAEGGEYGTALQAASAEGHEAVVRLLQDKGGPTSAAASPCSIAGSSPLWCAILRSGVYRNGRCNILWIFDL